MGYIKIRFGDDFFKGDADMQRNITDMFRAINPSYSPSRNIWRPHVDIYETPDEIIVLAEISGVIKDDIKLEVNSRSLKISGRRKGTFLNKSMKYILAEISYGYFERALAMPVPIDTENIAATYSNGLLQVTIKKRPVDTTQKIVIHTK